MDAEGLILSHHAVRRMRQRAVTADEIIAVIALCPVPIDQGDGTFLFRARTGSRQLGVVRASDGVIVTVLDYDRPR